MNLMRSKRMRREFKMDCSSQIKMMKVNLNGFYPLEIFGPSL